MKEYDVIWVDQQLDKKIWGNQFRMLWRECFHDPKRYEDFYFSHMYSKNAVARVGKQNIYGMLHANPYECNINGHLQMLHYIVGVATKEEYRRKGFMRKLLVDMLNKAWERKEPFVYLMPANTAYYEPFSFVSVQLDQGNEFICQKNWQDKEVSIRYMSYAQFKEKFSYEERTYIYQQFNYWLEKNVCVFPVRNEEYFDFLYEEKACQDGDVIILVHPDNNSVLGYFTYVYVEDGCIVEQLFCEGNCFLNEDMREYSKKIMDGYFNKDSKLILKCSYPYMIRIANVEEFINVFVDCFIEYAQNDKLLQITDEIISENNAIFHFTMQSQEVQISKSVECNQEKSVVTMSIEQLTRFIFSKQKNMTYFAEVV